MPSFTPRYEKVVQSGDLIEVYEYERMPMPPIRKNKTKRDEEFMRFKRLLRGSHKSERHVKRAVFNFCRKARATLVLGTPHMLTLTMVDTVDIATAYILFTEFGVRLRKVYGNSIAWITVPEFQKRGAVHFHTLIWNLPYDAHLTERDGRALQHLWSYGYVDCITTDGSPKLSGYLAKYMSKAMFDDRLFGKKAYSCSRNVMSPVSLKTKTSVAIFKKEFGIDQAENSLQPDREREYETRWLGRARYRAYDATIKKP